MSFTTLSDVQEYAKRCQGTKNILQRYVVPQTTDATFVRWQFHRREEDYWIVMSPQWFCRPDGTGCTVELSEGGSTGDYVLYLKNASSFAECRKLLEPLLRNGDVVMTMPKWWTNE